MKKNKYLIILLLISFGFLNSCQSVKEGLGGKKRSDQSDEFLVEKKNPLAMPPDFDKLPTPGNQDLSPETFSESEEVKDLLSIEDTKQNSQKDSTAGDIETSILEKIQ